MSHFYGPQKPEVRDTHARIVGWATLVLLIINTAMLAYIFYVVQRTVEALQQIGHAFGGQ